MFMRMISLLLIPMAQHLSSSSAACLPGQQEGEESSWSMAMTMSSRMQQLQALTFPSRSLKTDSALLLRALPGMLDGLSDMMHPFPVREPCEIYI